MVLMDTVGSVWYGYRCVLTNGSAGGFDEEGRVILLYFLMDSFQIHTEASSRVC